MKYPLVLSVLVALCLLPAWASNPGEPNQPHPRETAWVGCTREEIKIVWGTATSSSRDGDTEHLVFASLASPRRILRRLIADESSLQDDNPGNLRPLPILRTDATEALHEWGQVHIIASFWMDDQGVVDHYFISSVLREHPRVQPPPSCRRAGATGTHPVQDFAVSMINDLGGVLVKCPFDESERPETHYCVRFPEELAEFDVFRERWDAHFAEHFDDTNHLPLTEWEESEWRAPGRFERTYLVHGTKVEVLFSNVHGPNDLSFTLWYLDPRRSPIHGDDAQLQSQQLVVVEYDCELILSKGRVANYEKVRSALGKGVVRVPDKSTWNSNPPRQIALGSERFFIRLGVTFDSARPEYQEASANLRLFAFDDEAENLSIASRRDVDVSDGHRIAAASAGFPADCRRAHLIVTSPLVPVNNAYPYVEATAYCTFDSQVDR